MENTALARQDERRNVIASPVPVSAQMPIETLAGHLAKSGYFKDATDASKCIVKVMYGQELGFPAISSMMGIHIIEGKPVASATLMAAMVKRHPDYDYQILENTDKRCEIAWFERGQEVGRTAWTIADATRAELASKAIWKKYPRQMLFSRTVGEGVRTYFPGLFGGAPAYTADEARDEAWETTARVDTATGEVIDVRGRMSDLEPRPSAVESAKAVDARTSPGFIGGKSAEPAPTANESHLARFNRLWVESKREPKQRADYALRVLGRKPAGEADWQQIADDFADHPQALKYAMVAYSETGADPDEEKGGVMRVEMSRILGKPIESRRDCTSAELRVFGDTCRRSLLPTEAQQTVLEAEVLGADDSDPFEAVPSHPRSALVTGK